MAAVISGAGADVELEYAEIVAPDTLSPVDRISTQGQTPRNFGVSPDGAMLIAANSGPTKIFNRTDFSLR